MNVNALNYRLAVKGVFGRNRTAKFELYLLAKRVDPKTPRSLEELRPVVAAKLAEIKAKPGCRYTLREEPVEVETSMVGDREVTTEKFMLMSERVMLRGVAGGAEEVPLPAPEGA